MKLSKILLFSTLIYSGLIQAGSADEEVDPAAIALRDAILHCDIVAVQNLLDQGARVGFSSRYGGINHMDLVPQNCRYEDTYQKRIKDLLKDAFLNQSEREFDTFMHG